MLQVFLVVVLIAAIVMVIAARGGTRAGRGGQAARGRGAAARDRRSPALGRWGLAGGVVAAAGVALIGQATFGWLPAFDPPEWLRVAAFWLQPVGVTAAALLGALALRRDAGRAPGLAGLALALASILAGFALVLSGPS